MQYSYSRTAKAVFNTSFTTAMAFVSTGISPLMSISTFGWFAALCILVNYLFVISLTPAAIIVAEKYWYPLSRRVLSCIVKAKDPEDAFGDSGKEEKLGMVDRFFSTVYGPFILYTSSKNSKIKPMAIVSVVITLAWGIQSTYFTSQLTPPTKAEQWFPEDHMFTGITDRMSDNFMSGSDDGYTAMSWVFGIKGLDREVQNFNIYSPDINRGLALYDDNFDIFPNASQTALIDLCKYLETLQCKDENGAYLEGCYDATYHRLVRTGSLQCFMSEFREWHRDNFNNASTTAPSITRTQFMDRLHTFRRTTKPKNDNMASWKTSIGFIDGKLKYVRITFMSNLLRLKPIMIQQPLYNAMEKEVKSFVAKAPTELKTVFQEATYYGWVWMITQETLVTSLINGMIICFPIALAVLLVATGNALLSLYATVSIAFIVMSVLGFAKSFKGWDLGIAESIAGIIVIGFSVDYVVHMGHMYIDAYHMEGHTSREARFNYSIRKMGGTVFAGAVTTAGSGAFMFICQMTFFSKMANLICFTIIYSFVFSFGFFLPLCALVGPEGDFASLDFLCHGKKDRESGMTKSKMVVVKPISSSHGEEAKAGTEDAEVLV
jgi:predicted RND superfamily exporter protein